MGSAAQLPPGEQASAPASEDGSESWSSEGSEANRMLSRADTLEYAGGFAGGPGGEGPGNPGDALTEVISNLVSALSSSSLPPAALPCPSSVLVWWQW